MIRRLLLFTIVLLCSEPVRAVNTGGVEDNQVPDGKLDPCGGARNNSLGYSLRFGGVPMEDGLSEGVLLFEKTAPSPLIFTPQVLAYRCVTAVRIDEVIKGHPKTRYRISGIAESAVVFYVNDGESIGVPGGAALDRGERIVLLDKDSQPTPSGAANDPTFIRILYPDGSYLELSIATKEAMRFRSSTGRLTAFAAVPEEVATRVVKFGGVLRQIKAAEGLADIVTDGLSAFEVRLYCPSDSGGYDSSSGVYRVSGSPYRTIRFEKESENQTDRSRLKITDTWGSRVTVDRFTYDYQIKEWLLTQGEGTALRSESKMLTSSESNLDKSYRRTLRDSTGREVSVTTETKRNMPWGAVTISEVNDPDGLRQTTTYNYDYHSMDEPGYGKVRWKTSPDGYWESYEYDVQNRLVVRRTPFQDSVLGDERSVVRTTFSYSPLDSADQPAVGDARPRTQTVEKVVNGIAAVVGRSYDVYSTDGEGRCMHIAEQAVDNASSYGSPGNLRTTEVYFTGDSSRPDYDEVSAGRISCVDSPDGVRTTYSYARNRADPTCYLTCSTVRATSAQPGGIDGLSTRVDATYDVRGNLVRTRNYIRANSSWILGSEELRTYDDQGLHVSTSRDGRVTYIATYDGDRRETETGEDGVVARFTYDALGRVETETRMGAPAAGIFSEQADIDTIYIRNLGSTNCNCDGSVTALTSAGALTAESVSRNDAVGRISYKKDAAGMETNYAYALNGRQTTRINPDLGRVVIETYCDRRMKSVTGTGCDAQYTSYGVNSDGSEWTEVHKGSENGARWERTTKDMAGRSVSIERPAFDGGTLLTRMSYDAQGRLFRTHVAHVLDGTEVALAADTLVFYDVLGNVTRTGSDMDGDGTLTPDSSDRIADTITTYEQYESAWWIVRRTITYPQSNNASAVQVSETRQRASGCSGTLASETVAIDTYGNSTRQRTDIDLAAKTVTQTSTTPDSDLSAVSISYNGRQVSQTSTTVAAATIFGYDDLGRLVSVKDPRQVHPATIVYNSVTGQVVSKDGGAGNTTRYEYYPSGVAGAGRPSKITDPVGKTQRMGYDLQGRVLFQWGTAAYPQSWNYNATGELVSSTTWRITGAANIDLAAWPAPTGGDTTITEYQDSTGLQIRRQTPDGQGTDYTYDLANRLSVRTWARTVAGTRVSTTYDYDPLTGELLATQYSDGTPSLAFTYDRLGRHASVSDVSGTRSFDYNPTNLRLETETLPSAYFGARIITRNYEVAGDGFVPGRSAGYRLGVVNSLGQDLAVAYSYDAQGRFSIVNSGSGKFTYGYVPDSNLLSGVVGPKVGVAYAYDPDRNVRTRVTNVIGAVTISQFVYGFDAAGKRTSRVQEGMVFAPINYDRFAYDDRGQVTETRNYAGNNPANYLSDAQSNALARLFAYDAIGNRLNSSEGDAAARTYTTNALNQYSAITGPAVAPAYDPDGNQTSSGSGWYFDWDAENRLVRARSYSSSPVSGSLKIDYAYDYQSRRIRRTASTYSGTAWVPSDDRKYIYDGWNVVAEFNASAFQLLASYTWGLDLSQTVAGAGGVSGLLAVTLTGPTPQSYFATYDANGNVSEYINGTGGIEAHFAYDAFGQITAATGSDLGRFSYRFSTKFYEVAAGLYYYGYRYYSPVLGRWLSRDPLGETGGANLYSMVRNAAVCTVDFLGMIDCFQLRQAQIAAELAQLLRDPTADPQRLMQLFEQYQAVSELQRRSLAPNNPDVKFRQPSQYGYGVDLNPEGLTFQERMQRVNDGLEQLQIPVVFVDPRMPAPLPETGLRLPDFYTLNINVAIPNPWTATVVGWSGTASIDRYGSWYYSPLGVGIGKSTTLVSGSLTANWINQCEKPSPALLNGFLTEHGFNVQGGFYGGVSESFNFDGVTATGGGFFTPQVGGSYNYSFKGGDL